MRRVALSFMLLVSVSLLAETMLWPIAGQEVPSSGYGLRRDPMGGSGSQFHFGVDIPVPTGTKVLCAGTGIVLVCAKGDSVFGNYMIIHLDNGYDVLYAHMSETWIRRGEGVKRGQVLGLSGNTGASTGAHLHFQVLIDPYLLFGTNGGAK